MYMKTSLGRIRLGKVNSIKYDELYKTFHGGFL